MVSLTTFVEGDVFRDWFHGIHHQSARQSEGKGHDMSRKDFRLSTWIDDG